LYCVLVQQTVLSVLDYPYSKYEYNYVGATKSRPPLRSFAVFSATALEFHSKTLPATHLVIPFAYNRANIFTVKWLAA